MAALGVLIFVCSILLGTNEAYGASPYETWESAHVERVKVGPYDLTIHYTVWPVRAMTNQRFVIEVEGGIAGKSGRWRWLPKPGGEAAATGYRSLRTYPGINNAWVVDIAGMVDPGEWRWLFEINGPLGRSIGWSEWYPVGEPPGFPIWLGWVLGLFPLYGLIWFGLREAGRTRRAIAADRARG